MAGRKRGSQSERCGICLHEKVGSINYSLVRGTPHSAIYREYGFHHTTIRNHLRDHIGENYKRIIGAGIYRDIDDLLKQCVDGNAESLDVLNAMISGLFHSWGVAVSNNATQQIASLAAQLRSCIELRAKLTSELAPAQHLHSTLTVNAFQTDLTAMITGIARVLVPFPEARTAVLEFVKPSAQPVIEHAAAD